jgi:hypothetical protein
MTIRHSQILINQDRFFKSMDQLPAVLQHEIWDYVHGDCKYWKSKFEQVLYHLDGLMWTVRYLNEVTSVSACILTEAHLVKLVPGVLEPAMKRGKEAREQRDWCRENNRAIYPSTKSEVAEDDLAWWCANPGKFPKIGTGQECVTQ